MFFYQTTHFVLRSVFHKFHSTMYNDAQIASGLKSVFLKSVEAVKPVNLIENSLSMDTSADRELLKVSDKNKQNSIIDITDRNVHCVGFGKAVLGMAVALERTLQAKLQSGVISIPKKLGSTSDLQSGSVIKVHEGADYNLPDAAAERAALDIKQKVESMTPNDVLFVLISGGGSALLPIPRPPIDLDEKTTTIILLAKAGATINELNVVRIAMSEIKGGKLLNAAKNASLVVSLILSDIINDPVDLIASGPTVPFDGSNMQSPLEILKKYKLQNKVPKSVLEVVGEVQKCQETNTASSVHVIGSNSIAIEAAAEEIRLLGWQPIVLSNRIQGNIQVLAVSYVELVILVHELMVGQVTKEEFLKQFEEKFKENLQIEDVTSIVEAIYIGMTSKGFCFIGGGEPTATITGFGLGGRNQELALRFTQECEQRKEKLAGTGVVFLSAGTDGIDGPTLAAGAIGGLCVSKERQQLNLSYYIENNDSFTFYKTLSKGKFHIITGHTGTNVMDLHLLGISNYATV